MSSATGFWGASEHDHCFQGTREHWQIPLGRKGAKLILENTEHDF